jgi:hypothetical protein
MTILYKILGYITDGLGLIKKYPKFFLGVAIAIFVMLFFKQCEDNRQLKNSIEQLEVDIDNESNRTLNNIKALRDSVITINETNTYLKGVVRVKDGENEILSERIGKQVVKINTLKEKLDDKIKIKNVYVTDITSEIETNDVLTQVDRDTLGNIGIGIKDSNQVYSIETQTWFKLIPDSTSMKLKLVDKYGFGKSSLLKQNFNFSLTLSQLELPDGNTRVLITPYDTFGNEIPKSLLSIPYVDGVDFIDIEPQLIPSPIKKRKRTGFGVMIGPSFGLNQFDGAFRPTWGIGITVGYKIF